MPKKPHGRLELTWMGKDLALIPYEDGKYDYAWVEPNDPRVTEVRTLEETGKVGQAESLRDGDGHMTAAGADDNLLVIGDSGDALRSLGTIPEYRDRYEGQVKLVYIDPPFNTGQTFDHYSDQMEHSVWLTFMRDRIRDIKPLMAPDASIWVHLDDVENHRMRVLLDEEFGADNFVAQIAWEKADSPRMDAQRFSERYDTLLLYVMSSSWFPKKFQSTSRLTFPLIDQDGRAFRAPGPLRKWGSTSDRADRPTLWYPLIAPDGTEVWPIKPDGKHGYWRWKEEVALARAGDLYWADKGSGLQPYVKEYADSDRKEVPPETLWPNTEVGHNREAKAEIKALFRGQNAFATPKPERLLERVLHIGSNPGDLVLDCFAGSGTTAAVAQKMGRRWVTVELLEETAETFIVPRLTKVVDGSDQGGISTRTDRIPADGVELPDGMTAVQAQKFNTALTKVAAGVELEVDVASETVRLARAAKKAGGSELSDDDLATLARLAAKLAKTSETSIDVSAKALAPLRAATKTRDETTVRWSGGGGFTIARLGPSMYDVEDGPEGRTDVYLSQAATNGAWSAAIAGQLGYRRTADHPVFAGAKGRERLAVIDGVADEAVVRDLHANLAPGETVTVVAKAALEDSAALLRELAPGSTLRVAPAGLLQKGAVIR
ncbi:site-specific DNA-methyltransferase [Brachybacterium alimentarium]|uniref:site-specific DNA-methyltransferase n=1 Tax=Brachybacterium alimentarium TaxID=47845 RepID=UPI003FD2E3B1